MKTRIITLIALTIIIGFSDSMTCLAQGKLYDYRLIFSGGKKRKNWPGTSLLKDTLNSIILVRCADGATLKELQSLGMEDLATGWTR